MNMHISLCLRLHHGVNQPLSLLNDHKMILTNYNLYNYISTFDVGFMSAVNLSKMLARSHSSYK